MDFRDKDRKPLIKWKHQEEAFEAWKECARGRPCDYTGLTYEKLRGGSGIQWPCNEEHPEGTERLYAEADFNTQTEYCERYGTDLLTGAETSEMEHRAMNPDGRPSSCPPRIRHRTSSREGITPSGTRRGARSTTSTPAPRPPGPRSSRPPRPKPGSRSPPRMPRHSTWERAMWCALSRRGVPWRRRPVSAA